MKSFLIIIFFLLHLGLNSQKVYEVKEFFDIIKKVNITEEDSKKLIKCFKAICERYVYLDIIKNPPQPKDNYFNAVNLLEDLGKINTETRPLYDFYRDVKMVINKCQDLHFEMNIQRDFGPNINLFYCISISPVVFYVKDEDKKVYAAPSKNAHIFDPNIIDIIEANIKNPVRAINGKEPLDYIQNFNKQFWKLKSPNAQFTYNLAIHSGFSLINFPFIEEDLTNITLEYTTDAIAHISYKIYNSVKDNLFLNEYFYFPNDFDNMNNIGIIMPKSPAFKYLEKNNENLKEVKWDNIIENGNLRCKVDTTNLVNVIFQNTFDISNKIIGYDFFDKCFESFDNNNYPIIVIENLNHGGKCDLASYFKHYLNLYKEYHTYESFRYNEDVKNNVANYYLIKDVKTCKYIYGNDLFKYEPIIDKYGKDENGNDIEHKRTEIFDGSLINEMKFYDFRAKAKNIRKPHEIIIFTDGFSYSATSVFIKGIQNDGGAIVVGYRGNPNIEYFDSSQSPSTVYNTQEITAVSDNLSKEIKDLGFKLTYTIMESFSSLDYNNEVNMPQEYQINLVDERVPIFSDYDDTIYDKFIYEAKIIFEKYKKNCNPKNKKLLLFDEKCSFSDKNMKGGYECNDEGNWDFSSCIPSYCDNGYVFDKREKKCIEDICVNQRKKEINNVKKDKIYMILIIIFSILLFLSIALYVYGYFFHKFKKRNYLIILIVIFFIPFVVFLILYLIKKEYPQV